MSASRGHGKGRKHEKPKHDGKPSETEKPIEKQVRKLGLEVEILAVIVAVAIIAVLYVLSTDTLIFTDKNETANVTVVDQCRAMNPSYTDEDCNDLALKDRAMLENKPELCNLIKSKSEKNHCERYFE